LSHLLLIVETLLAKDDLKLAKDEILAVGGTGRIEEKSLEKILFNIKTKNKNNVFQAMSNNELFFFMLKKIKAKFFIALIEDLIRK
jgi:hypothetical protein